MVQAVEIAAYREQLHALLPPGRAWPAEPGTALNSLVEAFAAGMWELDLSGSNLLDDIRPNTTVDLISDWERAVGLPDTCTVIGGSLAVRRASVLEKLVAKSSPSASEFQRIGMLYGTDIVVEEHDQTRANLISGLNTNGGRWRFVWWISIPTSADVTRLDTVSDVQTPFKSVGRNSELECRLRRAAPAHTHLVIGYNAVPALPALADRTVSRGDNINLPAASGGDTPLSYSVTGLPSGVTFRTSDRRLRAGNNAALGTVTLTYTVEDDDGDTDTGTFQYTVET